MTQAAGTTGLKSRLVLLITFMSAFGFSIEAEAEANLEPVVVSQVKDADPGAGDGDPLQGGNNADQAGGVDLDGILIYDSNDGFTNGEDHGQELWRSDGTDEGTYLLKDISVGAPNSSLPSWYTEFKGMVYFTALKDSLTGIEMWRTDGTTEGTELFFDFNEVIFESGAPVNLTVVGDTMYFLANSDGLGGDAFVSKELWKTDGTVAGTTMVKDIKSSSTNAAYNLTPYGDSFFFTYKDPTDGKELWISDGT